MRKSILTSIIILSLVALSSLAQAEQTHTMLAYGKVGGLIPVSKLGPFVTVHLGGGYILPFWQRRMAVEIDLGYNQTTTDDTIADTRVGGDDAGPAEFSYTLTQRDLNLFLGPKVFILEPENWIVPYASIGLDLHFLQSIIEGEGGINPLGENREVSTKAGFAFRGGAGYKLGPGIITGEIAFAWAPIDHDITGDSHLGRLSILVGYTAMINL
jgi:hypothetical protein